MSFTAQYPGECADCGERIAQGDHVTYRADELVHVTCPSGRPLFDKPDAPLCSRCFCYHTGEC